MSFYIKHDLVKAKADTESQKGGKYVARIRIGTEKDGSPMYRYFKTQEEYESYLTGRGGKKRQEQSEKKKSEKKLKQKVKEEQNSSSSKTKNSSSHKIGEARVKQELLKDKKDSPTKDEIRVRKSLGLYVRIK